MSDRHRYHRDRVGGLHPGAGDVDPQQRAVFGDSPVVSATKSMTGHLLGASGALEAVATVLPAHHDVAPPTPNLEDPDGPALDVTRAEPRRTRIRAALSSSSGFGGHNAALIFRKP